MYEKDEERALVEAGKGGDQDALDSLVGKYRREIYYLCLKMVGHEEDAEDLAQQTFCNAIRSIGSFRGRSLFRTWLYQIAMNLCRTHLSKRKPVAELHEEILADASAASPLSEVIQDEAAREAVDNLKYLAEKQRAAVVLRIFHDLDYAEIGRIIGCSAKTAKVNFHYGIENLRKRMVPQ